jgi:hypothetical protein
MTYLKQYFTAVKTFSLHKIPSLGPTLSPFIEAHVAIYVSETRFHISFLSTSKFRDDFRFYIAKVFCFNQYYSYLRNLIFCHYAY